MSTTVEPAKQSTAAETHCSFVYLSCCFVYGSTVVVPSFVAGFVWHRSSKSTHPPGCLFCPGAFGTRTSESLVPGGFEPRRDVGGGWGPVLPPFPKRSISIDRLFVFPSVHGSSAGPRASRAPRLEAISAENSDEKDSQQASSRSRHNPRVSRTFLINMCVGPVEKEATQSPPL